MKDQNKQELNGTGKQKCTLCGYKSHAGIKNGHGKCPFHWAVGQWGEEWASKCYPKHPNANKHWQHEDTGRITQCDKQPSPRWYEIQEAP